MIKKSLAILFTICVTGFFLFSCEKESSAENFFGFSLRNAQETFFLQWNLDALEKVYTIGNSSNTYTLASIKIIHSKDELFSMLDLDTSEISEIELSRFKKLPQSINIDFTKQSIIYFGLAGCICNRVMANVHHTENHYIIRILSYLPDNWGTNWFVDTIACSATFPKISTGATFSIETIEIEGGTQEANKFMSNEKWFDIKN